MAPSKKAKGSKGSQRVTDKTERTAGVNSDEITIIPETERKSLEGSVGNLEIGQLAVARFTVSKLNESILRSGTNETRGEMASLLSRLMNIACIQDAVIKVIQAQLDACEKVKPLLTATYAPKVANTVLKVVKGTPQILLISSNEENVTLEVIEKELRDNLKPQDLRVNILIMRKAANVVTLTTKYKEDNELLEAPIREN